MATTFQPNVDLLAAFNSQVMLVNDRPGAENGFTLIKAGADGPPVHRHPEQDELIRVVSGQLEFFNDKEWLKLGPGEEAFVPKGTAHTYRSRSAEDCTFEYLFTPGRDFSGLMRTFERLSAEGKLRGASDLRSIVHLSMVFKKYSRELVMVSPPGFVISAMAGIGRLLGVRI